MFNKIYVMCPPPHAQPSRPAMANCTPPTHPLCAFHARRGAGGSSSSVRPAASLDKLRIPLSQLSLGWEESLHVEELTTIARLCPEVVELKGVSVGILDDSYRGDRHLQDSVMCSFLKSFTKLSRLSSNLKLTCLNSFLLQYGAGLTSLTCSALVLSTKDLLVMRK